MPQFCIHDKWTAVKGGEGPKSQGPNFCGCHISHPTERKVILIFDIDLKDQDHLIDLDLLAMILIFNGRILIFLAMILIFFGMILIFDLDHFQSDLLQPWNSGVLIRTGMGEDDKLTPDL